jgi:hypothetical protein
MSRDASNVERRRHGGVAIGISRSYRDLPSSGWGAAHASQSEETEVDESALAVYNASRKKLEELGYSVEERPAELEIMHACLWEMGLHMMVMPGWAHRPSRTPPQIHTYVQSVQSILRGGLS